MQKLFEKCPIILICLLLVVTPVGTVVGAPSLTDVQQETDQAGSVTKTTTSLMQRTIAIDALQSGDSLKEGKSDEFIADLERTTAVYIDGNRTTAAPFDIDRKIVAQTQQQAPEAATALVESDRVLAATAIADAEATRAALRARGIEFDDARVDNLIADANAKFRHGTDRQGQAPVAAVVHYGKAWIAAQEAIDIMDTAVEPTVAITTRLDPPTEESFEYPLAATVFDVRPYELEFTVSTAENNRSIPVNASTVPAQVVNVTAEVPVSPSGAVITVTATDPNTEVHTQVVETSKKGGKSNHGGKENDKKKDTDKSPATTNGSDTLQLDGDALSDTFEETVLQSNPRNPDSDAGVTARDEAGDGVRDGREDYDEDSLPTFVELYTVGTDPLVADTDGDGLFDGTEVNATVVNATLTDTDGDGVSDGQADFDGDGLSGVAEQAMGTALERADTDNDRLKDGREIEIGTNPLVADTDGDGLTDSEELRLGADPTVVDSDGDGTLDGDEQYTATTSDIQTGASVAVTAEGRNSTLVSLRDATPNQTLEFREAPVIEIGNRAPIDGATVTLPLEQDANLSNTSNLAVYKWDPQANGSWEQLETTIDTEAGTASADVSSFSYFTVFEVSNWEQGLVASAPVSGGSTNNSVQPIDLMFVIDRSGSMGGSRLRNAKDSAKRFVGALFEEDQAGLVGYATSAAVEQELTTDRQALNRSIDRLRAGGLTNTGAGLRHAVDEFDRNGAENRPKITILLSDGFTNRGPDPVQEAERAAERDVIVYTVAIGSGANEQELRQIADVTGGSFFQVRDAAELPEVFDRIGEQTTTLTDTDGDGYPDIVEEQTFVLPSGPNAGKSISLSPTAADTDGDGISDRDEITIDYQVDGGVVTARAISAIADPTLANTDGVGFDDNEELARGSNPFVAERLILKADFPTFAERPKGSTADDELELTTSFPTDTAPETYRFAPTSDIFIPNKDREDRTLFDDLLGGIGINPVPDWMPEDYDFQKGKTYMRIPVSMKMIRAGNAHANYELPTEYELGLEGIAGRGIIGGTAADGTLQLGEQRGDVVIEYTRTTEDLVRAGFSEVGRPVIYGEIDEESVFALDSDTVDGNGQVQMEGRMDREYSINDAESYRLPNLLDNTETALSASATILSVGTAGPSTVAVAVQTGSARVTTYVFLLQTQTPGGGIALNQTGAAGTGWVREELADVPDIDRFLDVDIVVVEAGPTITRAA